MPRLGVHALRKENERRREEKILAALAKKKDPIEEFQKAFGGTVFGDLQKRCRKVGFRNDSWSVLRRLLYYRSQWIRPLDEWKPKGKALETILRSLITHLICQYPMPSFWYEVWFRHDERNQNAGGRRKAESVAQFVELARGTGLYQLVKEERFPVPFTRKQCHAFMQQRGVDRVVQAVRWTQVQSLGGDRGLAEALCRTEWGEAFGDEVFRAHVIQWFCNQGMLDLVQVAPLLDYIEHAREENANWSMKGRTVRALMRDMEGWHRELAEVQRLARRAGVAQWTVCRKPPPEHFKPSGFKNWDWMRKTKDKRGRPVETLYKIVELIAYKDLVDEGRALRHCIASYAWSIEKGQKSIWSFSVDREKTLTIEVRNSTKTVTQVRGHCNRLPTQNELAIVQRWAVKNDLVVVGGACRRW